MTAGFGIDWDDGSGASGVATQDVIELRLVESGGPGPDFITVKAPTNLTASWTFTLPDDDGSANGVLITNGSGVSSWTNDLVFASLENGAALSVLGVTGSSAASVASIAAGTDHQVLRRSGSAVAFGSVNLAQTAAVTGTLAATNGGTGLATFAQGDLIYASASNTLAALAKNASATRYLSNTGPSNDPAWAQVNLANGVTGNLPVGNLNSGTGASSSTFWRGDGAWAASGGGFTLGTEQASTSGTVIDFTGIPAGVKQIIVSLVGVSTNGTSNFIIQLGDAGGVETTGYNGSVGGADGSGITQTLHSGTTGFLIIAPPAAAGNYTGQLQLVLEDSSDNTWTLHGTSARNDTAAAWFSSGHKALSATLDRVRITSASADTFDAGGINIAYQ